MCANENEVLKMYIEDIKIKNLINKKGIITKHNELIEMQKKYKNKCGKVKVYKMSQLEKTHHEYTLHEIESFMSTSPDTFGIHEFRKIRNREIKQRLFNKYLKTFSFKDICKLWDMGVKDIDSFRRNLYSDVTNEQMETKYVNVIQSYGNWAMIRAKRRVSNYDETPKRKYTKRKNVIPEQIESEQQISVNEFDLNTPLKIIMSQKLTGESIVTFVLKILDLFNCDNKIDLQLTINKQSKKCMHKIEINDTLLISEFKNDVLEEFDSLPKTHEFNVTMKVTEIRIEPDTTEPSIDLESDME